MTPEKYRKLVQLNKDKRKIEIRAKRRGNEFFYTYDEKSSIRSINAKIDRLIKAEPGEAKPQILFT
jgi:hypothetical protein